jgi:hypothetical protein
MRDLVGGNKKELRGRLSPLRRLTKVKDGRRSLVDRPPFISRIEADANLAWLRNMLERYACNLPDGRSAMVRRYTLRDVGYKVSGVAGVGLRCFVLLLAGRDEDDVIMLEVRQAQTSELEPYAGRSAHRTPGARVVAGIVSIEGEADPFLGWTSFKGRHYVFRTLRLAEGVEALGQMPAGFLTQYGGMCGAALAHAHGRSGEASAIADYLGEDESFDLAMRDFARLYAAQNEWDAIAFASAVQSGRISARSGL